jgi:hypothetical protein
MLSLDFFWILALAALERTVFDTATGNWLFIDLLTPWMVVGMVTQQPARMFLTGLLIALLRETHSTAPAGFYVTLCFMQASTLILVRPSLSWHHASPWLLTIFLGCLWTVLAESLVMAIMQGGSVLTPTHILAQGARLIPSTMLGMWLCRHRVTLVPVEEARG